MNVVLIKWIKQHVELLFWIVALTVLFFLPEQKTGSSLCVFTLLGFAHCPGCGIGHAIHYALHFDFATAYHYHVLGIPGVIIIFNRVNQLLFPPKQAYETKPHKPDPFH